MGRGCFRSGRPTEGGLSPGCELAHLPPGYDAMLRSRRSKIKSIFSQSVALATERVHQKRFIAGSLIHLLFSTPPGGYRLLHFPRNSMCQKCTTSKYSRPRLFRCNEKTAPTIFPQIAHDREIVDPRTSAKFKKKIRCRFCATGAGRKMRTGGCGGHVLKPNLLIR